MVFLASLSLRSVDATLPMKGSAKVEPVMPVRTVRGTKPELLGGGPDGYGYTYLSTQDGDSVPFNYVDITSSGTAMGAGDDWCSGSSASTFYYLGFSFPFYDQNIDSISICSNGTVVLENKANYLGLSNGALPSNGGYTGDFGFVAVMWDDLNPTASGADDIYFQSFSSCPDGYAGACAVIQYHNVPRFGGSVMMDFEVILYDNGDIKLQYNSAVEYADATVGVQDSTALSSNPTWYLQYVYNGSPSTHVPDSGTAVLFKYPVPIDYNVGVISITPTGLIDTSSTTFTATVRNFGNVATTSTPVVLNIYDTLTSTLVFSDTQTVAIPALSNYDVTFSPFTPSIRKIYLLEVITEEPMDTVHNNDTLQAVARTLFAFGDVVDSWTFPSLGDGGGYSFAGITYVPDSGKFYVITMNPQGAVFSFDPNDPAGTFTQTSWTPYAFFGSSDIPWGIAYHNGTFYVSHIGYDTTFLGNIVGYYDGDGNLIDSFDVWTNVENGGWIAGMDWNADEGYLYGVYVGGSNSVYKIDVASKSVAGVFTAPPISLRGVSVFHEVDRVIDGGWNQNAIYELDYSANTLDSAAMENMADVDVWTNCTSPDDPIFAFVTINDANNTLVKMATGHYCDEVGVAERKVESSVPSVRVEGRTVFVSGKATLYDVAGRKVATFRDSYRIDVPGVYFVKVGTRTFKVLVR